MRIHLFSIALLLLSPLASAKCLDGFYTVTGKVVSEDGRAASGAVVAISWVARGQAAGPAIATTDRNGRYTIHFQFDSFTKMSPRGDECNGRIGAISITALSKTARSESISVPVSQSKGRVAIDPPVIPLALPLKGWWGGS